MKRFLFVMLVGLLSGQSAGQSRLAGPDWVSEKTFEAHGVMTFHYGTIYEGALRNGWLHGPGVLLMPFDWWDVQEWQENCGQEPVARSCFEWRYEGEFRDGKFHGRGVLEIKPDFSDVSVYNGEFRDGKFHGQGRYWATWTASDGEYYKGEFRDDKYHGQGDLEESRPFGMTRSVGRFRDGGFFEGVVETSSWREGEEGCFIQDVSHGEAVPGSRRPCADK